MHALNITPRRDKNLKMDRKNQRSRKRFRLQEIFMAFIRLYREEQSNAKDMGDEISPVLEGHKVFRLLDDKINLKV